MWRVVNGKVVRNGARKVVKHRYQILSEAVNGEKITIQQLSRVKRDNSGTVVMEIRSYVDGYGFHSTKRAEELKLDGKVMEFESDYEYVDDRTLP